MASPAIPKKIGINEATINPRSCSSMRLVRIGDCPIMIPATNAPSSVCTPMKFVISARAMAINRITLITGISITKLSLVQRMIFAIQ